MTRTPIFEENPEAPSDQAERRLATDVNHSVIVQAPAGSGKTTLLVERYLKLLARVDKPEEILAITFTRKAASEMQSRVLDLLDAADQTSSQGGIDQDAAVQSIANSVLERSAALGWCLLNQPNRLKIQTIDAFALSLTRGLPVTSGFDPQLGLTENADELYRQAANRLLLKLYEDAPLTTEVADFLQQCKNDAARAERLLASMLAKRDQWLEVIRSVVTTYQEDPSQVAEVLELGVQRLNEDVIEGFIHTIGPVMQAHLEALADHAAAELGRTIDTQHARYRLIAEFLTTGKDEFRKQVTKRDGFTTAFPELKASLMTAIEQLAAQNLGQQVASLRHLPDPDFDPSAVHRLVNVCINLALANTELEETFKQNDASDFTTLILNARAALGHELAPTELALSLDYRIHHILVDEFQDTSVSQFRLFELLLRGWHSGDGNSFFAVGDPMQSIYRFRDADVGLFYQAWEHGIADVALEPVILSSNFRSDARLVQWNNAAFSTIMGARQDPILGQIAHRQSTPTIPATEVEPAVQLTLTDSQLLQVQTVTRRIETLLARASKAGISESIAVLVRSRSHLQTLIPMLRSRGISWHANDIDPLLNKPAVRDLLSLVGALNDPRDRLSWFSLLRTPFVGLPLTDLQAFAEVTDLPTLFESLQDYPLSVEGRNRLMRLAEIWTSQQSQLHEYPLRNVIEAIWIQLGGADAYEDPAALTHATRLLELIDAAGPGGISRDALARAAANLYASDLTESRLEILTIHKAKGLEFDHVLIPFLERTTPTDNADLLLWRALPQGLLMGVNDDEGPFKWLARENRLRERHERQRLLYVACTRARRSLSLFALNEDKPAESSMLALLQSTATPIERISAQPVAPSQVDLFAEGVDVRIRAPRLQRLKGDYRWRPPERAALALKPQPPPVTSRDPLDKRPEVVLGIVIHEALERLADQPLPLSLTDYIAAEQDRWQASARRHDLTPDDELAVVEATARQLTGVLEDREGRWLLEAHPQGQAELPVTAVIDGEIQNLIIDRTFVTNGVRWVVDYKTAMPPAGVDLDAFISEELSRYRGQLSRYATAAEGLFEEIPTLAIYFTAVPCLARLPA